MEHDELGELIHSAASGDSVSIDRLLERYLPRVHAYIRLRAGPLIRNRESCADLAQSVCRDVLQHLDRFQFGGEEGFRRWILTTARRKLADRNEYYLAHKRNVGREVGGSEASVLLGEYAEFFSPSRHASAREELQRVEGAFERLPEEQREAILLAKVVGLSRAEIGREIGKSEGAVRTLLHRALANLSGHL